MAGRERGAWVTVLLTPGEFKTLKLVIRACLEVGGDGEQLIPLAIRAKEAEDRYKALVGDGDGG